MAGAPLTENLGVLWASVIVEELVRNGLSTFFVSPGNRNAPFVAAIVANPRARAVSCMDERGAAYRALGHAKAAGRPGVLACTSGTALANYFPAVIEAFRDEAPLLILSADRPPDLVFGDANQSMTQPEIFGGFCRKTLNLPAPDPRFPLAALAAQIDCIAQVGNGPVHVNCPFRDPLLPLSDPASPVPPEVLAEAEAFFKRNNPHTVYARVSEGVPEPSGVREILRRTRRGLLAVGRLRSREDARAAADFADKLGWPVFCDAASSLKSLVSPALQLVSPDHPGMLELFLRYDPDTVLALGTGFVSKHYYQSVLAGGVREVILVSDREGSRDPSHSVGIRVPSSASAFIRALGEADCPLGDKDAAAGFLDAVHGLSRALEAATPSDVLSFPRIAGIVNAMIPAEDALFMGNSNAIRAFDAAGPPAARPIFTVSNRGVSGIEGNIATSTGYAEGSGRRVTAVMGDISFLHDLNSLSMLAGCAAPVIVVVVNNRGGRIFEKLLARGFPGIMTPLMTTPHDMDFSNAARQFGIPYRAARTPDELREAYREALGSGRSAVIEAALDPETDFRVFEIRKNIR